MKPFFYISLIALVLTPALDARGGGGGGGGHGGGGHSAGGHGRGGGNGGARRQGHQGGGSHNGARGHRGHGHWGHHSNHHGQGNWGHNNWNGHNYNSWNGPYYYSGFGWWAGGAFLTGLTFYTCTNLAIANTHTWQISNDDISTFNSWANQDNLTISEINDPNFQYLICSGTSCVKANAASD